MTATATLSNALVVGTGAHDLQASYGGDAGYSPSTSGTVSVVASQIATTLALGASSSSPSYGDQIVLTATLSPYGYKTVSTTGEVVTFYAGGVSLVLSEMVQDFSVSFNGGNGNGDVADGCVGRDRDLSVHCNTDRRKHVSRCGQLCSERTAQWCNCVFSPQTIAAGGGATTVTRDRTRSRRLGK